MKRTVLHAILMIFCSVLVVVTARSQTTVTAATTGAANAAASGAVVFGVTNSNTYGIAITTFSIYHNNGTQNGKNYTVWYHPTPSGATTPAPTINAANGWTQVGTGANISTTTAQITPVLTNQYLVIPPGSTYRIAIVCNAGLIYFSNSGNNSYTAGNVTIETGASTVNRGWAGSMPTPNLSPRYFAGSITFVQAAPNNLAAVGLLSPASNMQYCASDSADVRVIVRNDGGNAQSNFPVTAQYTGAITGTISTTYQGTLAAYNRDTILVGKINIGQGTYSIKAFTQLSTDAVNNNDTTVPVNFTFKKPVSLPDVVSDTTCPGGSAVLSVIPLPNTVYKWYASQTGGSPLTIGTSVGFATISQDTIMWISADSNNCTSDRVQIGAYIAAPPAPDLGPDTSFCESIPLILDAGYPGATYLWSTGDTTQTIAVTNASGSYWVEVTKYCMRADTIQVTIRPLPYVSGISFVRMNNTYKFFPSFYTNVEEFEWHFGDGATSTDSTPVHTYTQSVNVALKVMLIVKNDCASDTVYRTVPTTVNDIDESSFITVYPNPANDKIFVKLEHGKVEEITIVNMMGRVVLRENNILPSKGVNINTLPTGNYIIRLKTDAGTINKPVQIIR